MNVDNALVLFLQILGPLVWAAGGFYTAYMARKVARIHLQEMEESARFRRDGPSKEVIEAVGRQTADIATECAGLNHDLVARTLVDLQFLHPADCHDCPICKTTIPELTALSARISSLRFSREDPRSE